MSTRALGTVTRAWPWARSEHGTLPVVLVALTVVSGVVDAVSYLALGHVFVANMTGNVVFLGFALAGAPGLAAPASLAALVELDRCWDLRRQRRALRGRRRRRRRSGVRRHARRRHRRALPPVSASPRQLAARAPGSAARRPPSRERPGGARRSGSPLRGACECTAPRSCGGGSPYA